MSDTWIPKNLMFEHHFAYLNTEKVDDQLQMEINQDFRDSKQRIEQLFQHRGNR